MRVTPICTALKMMLLIICGKCLNGKCVRNMCIQYSRLLWLDRIPPPSDILDRGKGAKAVLITACHLTKTGQNCLMPG